MNLLWFESKDSGDSFSGILHCRNARGALYTSLTEAIRGHVDAQNVMPLIHAINIS